MKLGCTCALFLPSVLYDECMYSTGALILVLQDVCIHVKQNSAWIEIYSNIWYGRTVQGFISLT